MENKKKYVYGKYEFKIKYHENETPCYRRLSDRFSCPVPSLPYSLLTGLSFLPWEKVHSLIAK